MKPCLWPIHAADGSLVTRGFPAAPREGERVDHPHHVGLWFNFGNVNGLECAQAQLQPLHSQQCTRARSQHPPPAPAASGTTLRPSRSPSGRSSARSGSSPSSSQRAGRPPAGCTPYLIGSAQTARSTCLSGPSTPSQARLTAVCVPHPRAIVLRHAAPVRGASVRLTGDISPLPSLDPGRQIDRVTKLTAGRGVAVFKDDKEGTLGLRVCRELEVRSHSRTEPLSSACRVGWCSGLNARPAASAAPVNRGRGVHRRSRPRDQGGQDGHHRRHGAVPVGRGQDWRRRLGNPSRLGQPGRGDRPRGCRSAPAALSDSPPVVHVACMVYGPRCSGPRGLTFTCICASVMPQR